MADFAFHRGEDANRTYFVLLHSASPPEGPLWGRYLEALSGALATSSERIHIFAATDGGGPDPAQRKDLAEVVAKGDALTHVFTTDVIVRGIVTAFRWIAREQAVAHHPREFGSVCSATRHHAESVLSSLDITQRHLPPVTILATMKRAAAPSLSGVRQAG